MTDDREKASCNSEQQCTRSFKDADTRRHTHTHTHTHTRAYLQVTSNNLLKVVDIAALRWIRHTDVAFLLRIREPADSAGDVRAQSVDTHAQAGRQGGGHTHRQGGGQAGRQAGKEVDRQAHSQKETRTRVQAYLLSAKWSMASSALPWRVRGRGRRIQGNRDVRHSAGVEIKGCVCVCACVCVRARVCNKSSSSNVDALVKDSLVAEIRSNNNARSALAAFAVHNNNVGRIAVQP